MSYIQLSQISPADQTCSLPGQIQIDYELFGDENVPVDIFYQLNQDNNIYLLSPNNTLVKERAISFTHTGGSRKFSEQLTLIKSHVPSTQDDHEYCFLYVEAVNKINGVSDIKHCLVRFI